MRRSKGCVSFYEGVVGSQNVVVSLGIQLIVVYDNVIRRAELIVLPTFIGSDFDGVDTVLMGRIKLKVTDNPRRYVSVDKLGVDLAHNLYRGLCERFAMDGVDTNTFTIPPVD